jgi:hypothetical protein
MAAEYSRELSVKVLAGMNRLARLGFKQGGVPGYGLRRMLVSAAGLLKQELASGERKSIATDRVILIPGPADEVQCVRNIYKMLVSDKLSVHAITRELINNRVQYIGRSKWTPHAVDMILTQPKYAGYHAFGRTSSKLYTPIVKLPKSKWILTPGAFEPIVDHAMFVAAQRTLQSRTINQSNKELLDRLRALLASEGRLSLRLIQNSATLPSNSTYLHRFGSLRRAYELIGYGRSEQFGPIDLRRRTRALRDELISEIATLFPNDVSVVRRGGKWRSQLRMASGSIVSVLVARSLQPWKSVRWRVNVMPHEHGYVTLLARLKEDNCSFLDFHILPNIDRQIDISLTDPWLNRGRPLSDLLAFCVVAARVGETRMI